MSYTTEMHPISTKIRVPLRPSLQKPVTLKDIAEHVGLSHRTVSQALNGTKESTAKVSDKTRLRIEAVAKELGYRPNRAARALRTGSSGLLGILNFHGLQHHSAVRLHGALKEAHIAGVPSLVYQANHQKSLIIDACNALLDASVGGALLLNPPLEFDQECLDIFLSRNLPVVSVGGDHLKSISRYVPDRESSFRAITRHLLDEGYRSLCFLASPLEGRHPREAGISNVFQSVIQSAQAKGQKVSGRIHYNSPAFTNELETSPVPHVHILHALGYVGMQEIIASGDLPDAVLCRADTIAQGALLACREAGLDVPGQVAITGYDDEPASSAGWTPITSVGYSHEEVIRPAISELSALIHKKREPQCSLTLVPGRLVIRQSSSRHLSKSPATGA